MIKLNLADYNLKDGKFLRFLELGHLKFGDLGTGQGYFGYYGNMIKVTNDTPNKLHDNKTYHQANYELDKTDPLKRFNGLFNGRTYGGGRFVLIVDDQDDIIKGFDADSKWIDFRSNLSKFQTENQDRYDWSIADCIGNLHQSPQLFKELNND